MSCNTDYFQSFRKIKICRNKSEKYNRISRRYRRRNRYPRYKCKKHRDFCVLMDSLYARCDLYTLTEVKHKLQPFLLWLKREYELVLLPTDPDYRSGFETYGYVASESVDHSDGLGIDQVTDDAYILGQLDYISDRWQCSFRVRWLINLLEPEYEAF